MKSLNMTTALRKAIATRSRLEKWYHKNKTGESLRGYRKQEKLYSRLYKNAKSITEVQILRSRITKKY